MTTQAPRKMKKEDLILCFLYANGVTESVNEPISGRTRLIKLIFIFKEDYSKQFNKDNLVISEKDLPEFFPWKYGPMSKDVLQDIEFFRKIKFLKTEEVKNALAFEEADELNSLTEEYSIDDNAELEYVHEKYSLTDVGKKYVEEVIKPILKDEQWKLLSELKKRFNEASLRNILQYVYSKHPKSTDKSIIKDEIMNS